MRQTGKLVQENLPALHPAEASRMQCGGFAKYDVHLSSEEGSHIRILVLNTVMYSVKLNQWFPNPLKIRWASSQSAQSSSLVGGMGSAVVCGCWDTLRLDERSAWGNSMWLGVVCRDICVYSA